MNILFVIPQLKTGGTETHLLNLVQSLKSNHKLFLLCHGSKSDSNAFIVKKIQKDIESIYWGEISLYNLNFFKTVLKIKKNKIDLIHSFSYKDVKWDVFLKILLHNSFLITERRNIQHWRTSLKISFFERIRNYLTIYIIANSYAVKNACIKFEKVNKNKILVIYNSLNKRIKMKNNLSRSDLGLNDADFVILNVASIKYVKNQLEIIYALNDLKNKGFNNIKLILCGRCDGDYIEVLQHEIKTLELEKNIFFINNLNNPSILFQISNIFVLSSIAEGFSNSIIESLSLGLPVICSNVGGNPELIKNDYNGYLYDSKDFKSLSEKIQFFYRYKEKSSMIFNSKKSVKKYNNINLKRNYNDVYAKLG